MENVNVRWDNLLAALKAAREFGTLRDLTNYVTAAESAGDAPCKARLDAIDRYLIEGDVRSGRDQIAAAMDPLIDALLKSGGAS